jgi:type I restriction enzyme M protein
MAEGKKGGLVLHAQINCLGDRSAMLTTFSGRVYDPCCGSGGLFRAQSEEFVRMNMGAHSVRFLVYGQESKSHHLAACFDKEESPAHR